MANDNKEDNSDEQGQSPNEQTPPPTILSWTIRGVSLLVIFGLLIYFLVAAIQPTAPAGANVEYKVADIEQREGRWVVPFKVINTGGMGLHLIKVKGTLPAEPEDVEKTIIIPLLGSGERVTSEFRFEEDPRVAGFEFTVESYLVP
ncbi:hypothetical protein [Lewinella sp. 4G2]|uniref:hypothetical protein n=1 Tax=Lewinella sp. 4G2 TaxID=1803372 RepID=UPI0007B47EFE|nr:hypothetical protein [Lewinella sp. 4G2]OAV44246.1 hypothetical protein A3850_006945 [Lewinella sp. 4G2]